VPDAKLCLYPVTQSLIWEASNDASVWTQLAARGSYAYIKGQIVWEVVRTPQSYRYYRVRASVGTLDAQEIYYGNNEYDYVLGRLSRQQYDGIAVKTSSGIPVSYYTERAGSPIIHIFQTPDTTFTVLKANRIRQIQSVTNAAETLDAPFRFIEMITAIMAAKLAVKRSPDRVGLLKEAAKISIQLAQGEDRERVTASFIPDLSGYRI